MSADWTPHFSWIDIVREFFPDVSTGEAQNILWKHTSYPFENIVDSSRIAECRYELGEYLHGRSK